MIKVEGEKVWAGDASSKEILSELIVAIDAVKELLVSVMKNEKDAVSLISSVLVVALSKLNGENAKEVGNHE